MSKVFEITVIALLLINMGATFGLFYSHFGLPDFFYDDDYIIDLGENFSDPYEGGIYDHYTYDFFTYEEFGRYIDQNITDGTDVINYCLDNNYAYDADGIFHTCSKRGDCWFDGVLQKQVCSLITLEMDEEYNTVELTIYKHIQK